MANYETFCKAIRSSINYFWRLNNIEYVLSFFQNLTKKKYKMTFPFYVFQCHKNDLKRHKKEMKPLNLEARGGKLIRRKIYEREEARLLLKILLWREKNFWNKVLFQQSESKMLIIIQILLPCFVWEQMSIFFTEFILDTSLSLHIFFIL